MTTHPRQNARDAAGLLGVPTVGQVTCLGCADMPAAFAPSKCTPFRVNP
jgi:hypothetical protein